MSVDPMHAPGRRLYEQARALRRAKRRYLLRKVTRVPAQPGVVLQFPTSKEAPDGEG
jgi:hypothetical protein